MSDIDPSDIKIERRYLDGEGSQHRLNFKGITGRWVSTDRPCRMWIEGDIYAGFHFPGALKGVYKVEKISDGD